MRTLKALLVIAAISPAAYHLHKQKLSLHTLKYQRLPFWIMENQGNLSGM